MYPNFMHILISKYHFVKLFVYFKVCLYRAIKNNLLEGYVTKSETPKKKIVIKQSNTLEKIMATYKNGRYFCTMNTCKST